MLRREANGNCVLLGFYAASSANPLNMVPIGCHETSVRNNQYSLRNNPEKRYSQNEWSYTSTPPPLPLHGTQKDKFTTFTFATYAVCFQRQTDFSRATQDVATCPVSCVIRRFRFLGKAVVLLPAVNWCCKLELHNMSTAQQKLQRCFWYDATKSVTIIQRRYQPRREKDGPSKNSNTEWYRKFRNDGCLCKKGGPERPRSSDAYV
jgi:hypothetical protein